MMSRNQERLNGLIPKFTSPFPMRKLQQYSQSISNEDFTKYPILRSTEIERWVKDGISSFLPDCFVIKSNWDSHNGLIPIRPKSEIGPN